MLNIATICSGIGAPEKAFKNLGMEYNVAYFAEIDKFAVKSYCAIHNESESKNIGDITKIDIDSLPKNLDWIIGGTPCQDFSLAGKRRGGEIDSKTRSSLMWNFVEIIRVTQPKAILWENVKGALSEKDYPNYKKFIAALVLEGYKISAFTLNGKMFGVPQNRERVFVLGSKTHTIQAPKGFDCGIRLKDVLESKVDEKYYLSEKMINNFLTPSGKDGTFCFRPKTADDKTADCVTSRYYKCGRTDNYIADNALIELTSGQSQGARVYDSNGISVTLAAEGGGLGAKTGLYIEPNFTVDDKVIDFAKNKSNGECYGTYLNQLGENRYRPPLYEMARTIKADSHPAGVIDNYRIRKLTPLECFRLMGFTNSDYQKCVDVEMSNSQLYKQAGNSIIVQVLMAIFGEYYGMNWKPLVYGKWYKQGQSQYDDLPIMGG